MSIKSKVLNVLNMFVKRSYWYNNIIFDNCSKFWQQRMFGLDVVNLGSSSALSAFDYAECQSLRTANWAMAPQTLVADYQIIRNYCSYLKPGATVIIPLCPFSCLGGSNNILSDKYYTILDIASIPQASFVRKQQTLDLKNNPVKYYPLFQLFTCHKKEKTVEKDNSFLEKDAYRRLNSWKKEFGILRFTDPLSLINQDAYFDASKLLSIIIVFCQERKLRPVIVMPPVSKALQHLFDNNIKKLVIDDFVSHAKNENSLFLDYFTDERFTDDLFKDSFLLNEKGAKLFTQIVLNDLNIA